MKKIDECSELLLAGKTMTLSDKSSDVNAKIYIKAKDNLRLVRVDHELIEDTSGKKCDFMILGENSNKTHMIELKGKNIEAAFEQISSTIDYMLNKVELKDCVVLRNVLDAYIVSPERQKVPNIPSRKEKELARKLANGSRNKPKDMFDLIYFVKVVKSQKSVTGNGRHIIISGSAPLELD